MTFLIIIVPLCLVRSLAFDVSQTSNQRSHRQSETGSSVHIGHQDVFIDTIIRNTSLSKVVCEEDSDDEHSESYEDSFSDISESSSSESSDDDLFIDINHLQMSCDDDFLNHDPEDINDYDTT